jgi:hypothetical protein
MDRGAAITVALFLKPSFGHKAINLSVNIAQNLSNNGKNQAVRHMSISTALANII